MGDDAVTGIPQTRVSLFYNGTINNLGVFEGSCAALEDGGQALLPNEQSGVLCWYAGGGIEIGVFLEDTVLVVKKGFVDEGTAESEGFRGNFSDLLTLPQ